MAASYLSLSTRMPPSDGMDVTDQYTKADFKQEALQHKVNYDILIYNTQLDLIH